MKKSVWGLLLLLMVFACKEHKKENTESALSVEKKAGAAVKLYTFDGGTVQVNQLQLFSQDTAYAGLSKEFADAFYVIQHPKGNLMWDAGLPEGLVGMSEPFTSADGAFTVSRKDSLAKQLKSIGMTVDDFKYIALSHTHFDHSGHANALQNATWLVPETEYDFITSETVKKDNADLYDAIKDLTKIKKIKGDYDVFGDGTVVLKYAPGHTPGHQVLFLDLVNHGPMLLSGDLYHFSENREFRRIPIFNYDVKQTNASMDMFEAFAKEKEAKVYLQHSREDFDKMPKSPEFLN